jgi:hypothetical protein
MTQRKTFEKPIDNDFHDMTLPTSIHYIETIDATEYAKDTDIETLTKMKLKYREQYAEMDAVSTANAKAIQQTREAAAKEAAKKGAEIRAAYADPMYLYPKKFRYHNINPSITNEFLGKLTDDTIKEMIHKIEAKPMHYRGQFYNQVGDAVQVLRDELKNRQLK